MTTAHRRPIFPRKKGRRRCILPANVSLFTLLVFYLLCAQEVRSAESEQPTPEAGQEYRTKLFGEEVYVPPRDRRSVTAASFGTQWIPNGPSELEVLPFGALYIWRNWDDENRRFRGTFSIAVNDLIYTIGLKRFPNWSLIFTLNNFIVPIGRSEYVEGQRVSQSEIEW